MTDKLAAGKIRQGDALSQIGAFRARVFIRHCRLLAM
jgi:hypothetical protein